MARKDIFRTSVWVPENVTSISVPSAADDYDLAAIVAHERCHALYDIFTPNEQQTALSERELECMRWVADGKTDWEIGMILKISEATARFHVDRARGKLHAVTRAQAVARLVARGLLQPQ